ncbi:Acyl-CoA hydrolase [Anaerosphaera aminiphila DSM 21120]|uniref:Acyl-CoA hydrolase n=1 Tax=Anaerosphaera aminiphila DSM 21120 TaxID=1120995 RepID=A0A1M5U1Z8_9FIRM|nr:acyl-CoA thioesterase [Anaerosphaera aminiphila]SHH57057.1 Acyl-CoA hydrolase [Anaerosphaera aminiphila DSM 21120]
MKEFSTSQLVLMGDLNHHGTLFVGKALTWLSETGFMTASMSYKNPDELVFLAMNGFKFLKPVPKGDIVTFTGKIVHLGNSSITVYVKGVSALTNEIHVEGFITYVCIDQVTRKKKNHGLIMDDASSTEEIRVRNRVLEHVS